MYKFIKIFLPVVVFAILITPVFASIATPVLDGTCGGRNTELSGNGVGEVMLDNSKVTEANGVWSFKSDIKSGNHTVVVGTETLDFSIPKCPEGGMVIGQTPCLGLFKEFWTNCQNALKASQTNPAEEALIADLRSQIEVLKLQIQLRLLVIQLQGLGL